MAEIIHRVGIKAAPSQVYSALSTVDGLARWWTKQTSGDSKVGGTITFRFQSPCGTEIGGFDMDVRELAPEREVRWRVKGGPDEWLGTDIDFELTEEDDYTLVRFGHRNWREPSDFMAHCSTKWATFLMSLKSLVETGKGRPSPDDVPVGDWH